jgi:hypothetical protein
MTRSLLLATAAAALLLAGAARADTIFSTLGPGNTYGTGAETILGTNASIFGNPNTDGEFDGGGFFTPSQGYEVTQLDLALTILGGTNRFDVSLQDVFGHTLGQWTVSNVPPFNSTTDIVQTISGITGVSVAAGFSYEIVVAPGAADTFGGFNNGVGNQAPAAFDVLGTPADVLPPTPPPPGVPEPASWALALMGFGAIGAALRTRRARALAA